MESVKLNRKQLLKVIKENRAKHWEVFERAFEGYRRECIKVLEQNLDLLKQSRTKAVRFTEVAPQDHTSDYDRVILMLEMSVEKVVELSQREFQQYVQDDWQWKQAWSLSNSKYTGE